MKLSLQLTADDLVRALRLKLHGVAEDVDLGVLKPMALDQLARQGTRREPARREAADALRRR